MIKMPKEMKEKWLEALRSGKFQQGNGRLEKYGKYCCLGVLQCIVDGDVERDIGTGEDIGMPSEQWLKDNHIINGEYGAAGAGVNIHKLAGLNDGTGNGVDHQWSFAEIANYIEESVMTHED